MSATASRSRGRPKSEEKRESIYQAATRLFLAQGYDGVSMDLVAEQAGVSKQTVYSHFANKEALFAACVRNRCTVHRLGPELLDEHQPVDRVLREFAHHLSDLLLSDEAIRLKRLLCAQAESNPRLSELFYEAGPQSIRNGLVAYLGQQVERGRLKISDISAATNQLIYMVQGDRMMRQLLNVSGGPDRAEHERYVDQCVDLFLTVYATDRADGG